MRILCRAEQETRDQNIVSMAADDITQLRQLRERMQVEHLIKSKDRLSACIDDIINKLRVERNSVKDLQNLLQNSFDGVQGMLEDGSRLTDQMRDTFTRPPYVDNKAVQGALKNQEECVACLREWMLQAQEWHQLSIKKLELLIESRSTAIEEYLDRRFAIDDWDFEMTSTTEATMLLTSALDQLDRDSDVTCAILVKQLVSIVNTPHGISLFCYPVIYQWIWSLHTDRPIPCRQLLQR